MKFDRTNKFDLCYYGQVISFRLKSSLAPKWTSKHLCWRLYLKYEHIFIWNNFFVKSLTSLQYLFLAS